MTQSTTRTIVRQGVASYFGGTYQAEGRCWQNGPLTSSGLGTVRAGWGKVLNDADFVAGMAPGRGMGAYMIVEVGRDKEYRRGIGGPPTTDGNGSIITGGTKFVRYRVSLQIFHMAAVAYAEDAQADIDVLIEAVKQQIRLDRTLGGICTEAGEGRFGIETSEGRPEVSGGRVRTWITISFEALTQFTA